MEKIAVTIDDSTFPIQVNSIDLAGDRWSVSVDGESLQVLVSPSDSPDTTFHPLANNASGGGSDLRTDWLVIDGRPYEIIFDPALRWIHAGGRTYQVGVRNLDAPAALVPSSDGRIKAPIPGQITHILVEPGQHVERGSTLLILEAMKMENHILAPVGGVVSSVSVAAGQTVMLNQVLAEITRTA